MIGRMSDEAIWRKRVDEWRSSGLPTTRFTEGRGYSASALRYWAKVLEKRAALTKAPPVRLARLVREDIVEGDGLGDAARIAIEVGRARVSVGRGFDRATLRAVLEIMAELATGTTP